MIDWLNGRARGVDKDGTVVTAPWHNGKTGLIGKSYDGTLANAVAASGVEGLTTIVPISAIASYYDYTRTNGVIQRGNNYLASLANTVTNPDRRAYCAPVRAELDANDGDENGDYSDFWAVRDYLKDLDKVKASVFITHGIQDENVRADHMSKWWYGLKERGVPRKLWIMRQGHVDPFDGRRAVWVDTIHRWFDYWLQGVQNGIMSEPAVDIEESKDVWKTYTDWPVPGTQMTDVFLQGIDARRRRACSAARTGGATDSLTFRDANLSENNMLSLTNTQANKRTFLSAPLKKPLRISGTPIVELEASLSKTQSNLTALIVDYGPSTQTTRNGDGVGQTNPEVRTCWGESVPDDTPCFRETTKPTQNVTQWRVTKGMMDSSNRLSLRVAEPVTIGQKYRFTWPTLPEDFTFAAGHRIGIVIGANFSAYGSTNGMTQTDITVDTKLSKVKLPITGGYDAGVAAGLFSAETVPPAIGPMSGHHGRHADQHRGRDLSDADGLRQRGPDARDQLRARLRHGVHDRPDDRHLHGARRPGQHGDEVVHGHRARHAAGRRHRPGDAVADARRSGAASARSCPGVDKEYTATSHRQRHQHGGRRDAQRLRARQPDERHVLAARGAARRDDARQLDRPGVQRRGRDHVPPAHRRERRRCAPAPTRRR